MGSGLQRIRQVCVAQGLPEPKIQESGDFVDVELYRPIAADSHPQKPDSVAFTNDNARLSLITPDYARLSVEQQQILRYLLERPKMTRADGVALLQLSETKLKSLFNELLELGLITRQGQGRATVYVLMQKNE